MATKVLTGLLKGWHELTSLEDKHDFYRNTVYKQGIDNKIQNRKIKTLTREKRQTPGDQVRVLARTDRGETELCLM